MISLRAPQTQRSFQARRELAASAFIPYACHWTDDTLLTKSGDLLQIITLDGYAFDSADDEDIQLRNRLRNVLLKSVASRDYALWFHLIRTRQPRYPAGDFAPGFARVLNDRWKDKNRGHHLFDNALYITILKRGHLRASVGLRSFLSDFTSAADFVKTRDQIQLACRDLSDTTRRFITALDVYSPRLLSVRHSAGTALSEPLSFLGRLINLEDRSMRQPNMDLSRYLPSKRLFFGERAIECRGARGSRFAAMVSIKDYCAETVPGMLDGFLQMPFEFILTQSFLYCHRHDVLRRMQLQERRMDQTHDLAISQREEISQALDDTMSGDVAFGYHHLSVMPIVSGLDELDDALARVESELLNAGIVGIREDLNMEACFWSQLPGNATFIARRALISSANVAAFASLHNYPSGQAVGNHWGPAVTVLETQSGTPYFFNFHAKDVGHTALIGPTGSGKTALLNFLCAQACKFNTRLFYFDRDRGSEIFIRAMGGLYAVLGPGQECGFNPLQLPDTPHNRAFQTAWLGSLVSVHSQPLAPDDAARVAEAVSGNYRLRWDQRTLANVAPFLGLPGPGSLASRLAAWYGEGPHASYFGAAKDTLSLDHRIMGFDMGGVVADDAGCASVLLYLFHRIESALDGTPTLIVLDEAWSLLKHPLFAARLEAWLKTCRKRNAVVVFATQSVEDATSSPISATIIGQTATHVFFPNPKATEQYRSVFQLTAREFHLLREELDPASHGFLLKQSRHAMVARVDFTGMRDILAVLSGRTATVREVTELRQRLGDAPDHWLPAFMEAYQ